MDWYDIKLLSQMVLLIIFLVVLITVPVFGVSALAEKNYCSTLQTLNPKYNFFWNFWSGCLVEIDGVYMDVDYINKTRQEIELNSK